MRFSSIFVVAAVLPSILGRALAGNLTHIVTLSSGVVSGSPRDAGGIIAFKGIPYAQPPVGNLRWAPPVSPNPWDGTLNATQFGSTCWNNLVGGPMYSPYNEDCLTINLWTGAFQTDEKRPVMVWFYGGGFQFGSSANPLYTGDLLAQQGVILVSFNYRLGVFGFLGLSELDDEGHPSGCFGLQDQLAALKWIKQNIAAFGGDADNITVFGESAGAHAIGILMASPLATGMFHKAIMESGAWWDRDHGPLTTFAEARLKGLSLEQRLGVTSVAQLRNVSAQDLNAADPYFSLYQDPGFSGFAPSIDNYVVPHVPGKVFQNGQQMQIPLLAGWNEADYYLFLGLALPHNTASQYESAAKILFSPKMPQFLALYPDNAPAILNASSNELIGDLLVRQQTWDAADLQHHTGNSSVWVYYYTYKSSYEPIASHTAEEPFVFGNLVNNPVINSTQPPTAQDRAFSNKVMAYWTNFVKHGNPNQAELPAWPAYGSGCEDMLQLGDTITSVNYNLDRFRFIRSFRQDGVLPFSWRQLNVTEAGPTAPSD